MKTKILVAIVAAVVVDYTAPAQTNLTLVDTTTPHTNATWSTGSTISALSKGWTNVSYTTTNPAAVYYGDSAPTAYGKINNSLTYLNSQQISNATKLAQVAAENLVFSLMVTNLNGSNLMNGTVSSNKLDAATLSWLGSLGGGGGGSTMNYDSGNITSDGSGNINAVGFKGSLIDYVSSAGSSGNYAKANGDGTWQWEPWPATLNYDSANITSDGSGNLTATTVKSGLTDSGYSTGTYGYTAVAMGDGTWTWMAAGTGGVTNIVFTNTVTLAPGSSATATNVGVVDGIAYFSIGIPAGAPGTNFVTAYALTNSVFSSQQLTLLNTNFTFASSNYLGVFTNVMSVRVTAPQVGGGGAAPPVSANYWVWYSTNNMTSWTTNPPNYLTNIAYVAVTVDGTGAGRVDIFSVDRPELDGRLNNFTRQRVRVADPTNSLEAVNKQTMETAIANAVANQWQTSTNGDTYYYGPNSKRVFALRKSDLIYSTNITSAIVSTNFTVSLAVTNFVYGWQLQMSPALELTSGFQPISYYTLTTNTGIATFAIPLYLLPADKAFFRIVSPQTAGVVSDWPVQTPYVWFGTNVNFLTNTVTHSTNSTLGYGAGLMTMDTNYIYVSIGSNAWRRISIPTNTW
jgi:hypothetical protein